MGQIEGGIERWRPEATADEFKRIVGEIARTVRLSLRRHLRVDAAQRGRVEIEAAAAGEGDDVVLGLCHAAVTSRPSSASP